MTLKPEQVALFKTLTPDQLKEILTEEQITALKPERKPRKPAITEENKTAVIDGTTEAWSTITQLYTDNNFQPVMVKDPENENLVIGFKTKIKMPRATKISVDDFYTEIFTALDTEFGAKDVKAIAKQNFPEAKLDQLKSYAEFNGKVMFSKKPGTDKLKTRWIKSTISKAPLKKK